jgi:hypothetical protein
VNPTLTIIANALRVGDNLLERVRAKMQNAERRMQNEIDRLAAPAPAVTEPEPVSAK